MQQRSQLQGIQGQQRVPETRQAGFIAIIISGFATLNAAPYIAHLVEGFIDSQGWGAGYSIGDFVAIMAFWMYGAQFIQFIIDEYILIPFYQNKAIRDMKRLARKIEDKGSAKKRYGWGLIILAACWLYFK